MTVTFDGGIRRGAVHGRQVCVRGAADGTPGAARALSIFKREIDITMAQIRAPKISDLGPQFLMWKDDEDLKRKRR